jgi:hypothetical protein
MVEAARHAARPTSEVEFAADTSGEMNPMRAKSGSRTRDGWDVVGGDSVTGYTGY